MENLVALPIFFFFNYQFHQRAQRKKKISKIEDEADFSTFTLGRQWNIMFGCKFVTQGIKTLGAESSN